jgi:hypothetical protein
MSKLPHNSQSGAVIVMFAMYTFVFVTIVALAVNVYLIGHNLMQQRNAVEYVGMAVLKIATQPAVPFPAACTQDELSLLNCILARAEVAGRVGVGGSQSTFYLPSGMLQVKLREGGNPCGNLGGAADAGGDGSNLGSGGGASNDDFCWPSYQVVDEGVAELMMGTYSVANDGTGSFAAAAANAVKAGSFNAVKLRFHFAPNADNTKMIAPLIGLFGGDLKLKFSSSAIAYRTPAGGIHLAIDPNLPMGS